MEGVLIKSTGQDFSDLEYLLQLVAATTGVSITEIKSPTRKRPVPQARQIYCSLACKYFKHVYTLREIGLIIIKDHATVLHHVKQMNNALNGLDHISRDMKAKYHQIEKKIHKMTQEDIKRIIHQTTKELELAEETHEKLCANKVTDPGLNFADKKQYEEFKNKASGRVSALRAKIRLFSRALKNQENENIQSDVNAVSG